MEPEDRGRLSDRELLVRIDTRLESVIEEKKDHENRIRILEGRSTVSAKQLWAGIASAIAAASAAFPLIQWVINK